MASMKTVGRPPKYKCKEEIEEKITEYFTYCDGTILKDDKEKPILNKYGKPIIINQHPPTVTGLALALGFTTRTSLLNYQGKREFMDTITRAKSMIERYTEERLFDKDGTAGAQFSLRNNFKGWSEKQQTELDMEEQRTRIEVMKAKAHLNEETEMEDDGFLEALQGTAAEDWSDEEE